MKYSAKLILELKYQQCTPQATRKTPKKFFFNYLFYNYFLTLNSKKNNIYLVKKNNNQIIETKTKIETESETEKKTKAKTNIQTQG